MSSTKSKLRLTGAFAALAALALAVSCQGFFPHATLQSIALQPLTPSFGINVQQTMQAWGTDSNSNRFQLTHGVLWTLSSPSTGIVATIDPNTGTMTGKNAGTITVTASSEGLSGTTTATVVQIVSSMTINPTSTSVQDTGTAYAPFVVKDQNGNDISSLVTLTAYQASTVVTQVPCAFQLGLPGDGTQDCVPASGYIPSGGATQTLSIVVTYSGYTGTAVTATLYVTAP